MTAYKLMKVLMFFMLTALMACFQAGYCRDKSLIDSIENQKDYHILKIEYDEYNELFLHFYKGNYVKRSYFYDNNARNIGVSVIDRNGYLIEGDVSIRSYYKKGYSDLGDYFFDFKWDFVNRKKKPLLQVSMKSCKNSYYKNIIKKKYFKGLPSQNFTLVECKKIDFDGNGTDEVIFSARNYPEGFYKEEVANPGNFKNIIGIRYISTETHLVETSIIEEYSASRASFYVVPGQIKYEYVDKVSIKYFKLPNNEHSTFIIIHSTNTVPQAACGPCSETFYFLYFQQGKPRINSGIKYF